jgi:sensor histidine kinase YesM
MKKWRNLALILLVNTAAGVVPSLFGMLFRSGAGWADFLHSLRYSLVYAYCIGTLCFAVLIHWGEPFYRLRRIYCWLAFATTFIVLGIAGCALATAVFTLLGWIRPDTAVREFHSGVHSGIAFTVLIGGAVTIYEILAQRLHDTTEELQRRQLEEERARKLATEARLSSLESRIHPHFLFNTLNSISALIREDPARAERTVERLAALLRFSLDTAHQLVPLRQELRVVRDYLEIERTRFGDRLRYALDVPEALGELEIPPLALQTLVENSIKHAVSPSRGGGEVLVSARLAEGCLVLEVSDNGPGFDAQAARQGHGLENLRERLAVLYNDGGRLEIARRGNRTTVSVAVPQKRVLV